MFSLKVCVFLVCCGILANTAAILQARQDPLSLIWHLTNYALHSQEGRQSYYHPNYLHTRDYNNVNVVSNMQTILGILHLIARNDDHHCVPKLLCEFVSGGAIPATGRQTSLSSFQIDMNSLSSLLSAFEGPSTSPIILFGKAALLGYSSKAEDPETCTIAYPRCPKNPDVLLNYLNNHNGGFFRYFNSMQPVFSQNSFDQVNSQNQISFNPYKNNPSDYGERIRDYDRETKYFRFPYKRDDNYGEYHNRKVIFPVERFEESEYNRFGINY